MKGYTDLEQSKKLAEILPLESADMYWWSTSLKYYIEAMDDGDFNEEEGHIPAWSLSALERLMPFQIIKNNNRFGFYQVKGFNKQGETYRFGYKTNNNSFLSETSWHNNAIDAAYEIVCWLKNEKYI